MVNEKKNPFKSFAGLSRFLSLWHFTIIENHESFHDTKLNDLFEFNKTSKFLLPIKMVIKL